MKHVNWLVKLLFYKHKEKNAVSNNSDGVFYKVGFIDQLHANLCTNACESMLKHFAGRPFATMATNPRRIMQGSSVNPEEYNVNRMQIDEHSFKNTLINNGPFILCLPLKYGIKHSVVVTGCTKGAFIYNDPLTGAHKTMSFKTLNDLCGAPQLVEIATPLFVPSNLALKREKTLPSKPQSIVPKCHNKFFDLTAMEDPCQAVKRFLKDYANFSLWHLGRNREHKKLVNQFLKHNVQTRRLTDLLVNLETFFSKDMNHHKGELFERLKTIQTMMNHKFKFLETGALVNGIYDRSFSP